MSVAISHLFSLVLRSVTSMPERIGSNWGGVLFSLAIFFIAEVPVVMKTGGSWAAWKTHWKTNVVTGVGVVIASWVGLFVFSFVANIYDDHQNMVGAASRIKKDLVAQRQEVASKAVADHQALSAKVQELTTVCAVKEAIKETLEKQNRDEQVLIAGCQQEAIKKLSAETIKAFPLSFDADYSHTVRKKIRWVVVPNKAVESFNIRVSCVKQFELVSLVVMGGGIQQSKVFRGSAYMWDSTIAHPWTPTTPLLVEMIFSDPGDQLSCSFEPR